MRKLLIGVPTFDDCVCTETMESIFNLDFSPVDVGDLKFVKGYDCAMARNKILQKGLDEGYTHVLMVDGDVILPEKTLELLFDCEVPLAVGWYRIKADRSYAAAYKWGGGKNDRENQVTVSDIYARTEPFKIRSCGLGCALVRTDILRELTKPWANYMLYSDGNVLSEDLYFCSKVRGTGNPPILHPLVECKHIKKEIF